VSMELIFVDPYYDSVDEGKDFSPELMSLLTPYDESPRIHHTDIGHGAASPAYLVEIFSSIDWSTFLTASGVGATFLMGKRIQENLDAWIELSERIGKLVLSLHPSRIDEKAAALLAIKDVFDSSQPSNDFELSLQIIEYSPMPSGRFKLDKRPDALYLVTINTGGLAHIYGIKSDGNVSFRHVFGLGWYEFND